MWMIGGYGLGGEMMSSEATETGARVRQSETSGTENVLN